MPMPQVPTMKPAAVADAYGLEVRCKLLEIAAILDRHDRGKAAHGDDGSDAKLLRIHESLKVLATDGPGRVERIARIYSDVSD